jgi:hypothetical protein
MNLRHAVALALVGWYLMVPRVSYDPQIPERDKGYSGWTSCCLKNDGTPDFSKWDNVESYDTAAECEDGRSRLDSAKGSTTEAGRDGAKHDPEGLARASQDAVKKATCLSSDDPRLKEK